MKYQYYCILQTKKLFTCIENLSLIIHREFVVQTLAPRINNLFSNRKSLLWLGSYHKLIQQQVPQKSMLPAPLLLTRLPATAEPPPAAASRPARGSRSALTTDSALPRDCTRAGSGATQRQRPSAGARYLPRRWLRPGGGRGAAAKSPMLILT